MESENNPGYGGHDVAAGAPGNDPGKTLPECLAGYVLYRRYTSGGGNHDYVGQTVTVSGLANPDEIKLLCKQDQIGSRYDGPYWIPLASDKVICVARSTCGPGMTAMIEPAEEIAKRNLGRRCRLQT